MTVDHRRLGGGGSGGGLTAAELRTYRSAGFLVLPGRFARELPARASPPPTTAPSKPS